MWRREDYLIEEWINFVFDMIMLKIASECQSMFIPCNLLLITTFLSFIFFFKSECLFIFFKQNFAVHVNVSWSKRYVSIFFDAVFLYNTILNYSWTWLSNYTSSCNLAWVPWLYVWVFFLTGFAILRALCPWDMKWLWMQMEKDSWLHQVQWELPYTRFIISSIPFISWFWWYKNFVYKYVQTLN